MRIEAEPPFELTPEPDGTKHAVKDHIQISVHPDLGEVVMKHRVGNRPEAGLQSRWLYVYLKDKDVRIYVNGTHVVVAEAELAPTFTENTHEELANLAFKKMKVGKTEKSIYTMDTEHNRRIVAELFRLGEIGARSRLLAKVNHAAVNVLGEGE